MKKLILAIPLYVLFSFAANSQNLVPNYSFEDYDSTYVPTVYPFFNHTFESLYDWRTEWNMFNTPDLFFEGSEAFFVNIPTFSNAATIFNVDEFYVSSPNNYAGTQNPRTGLRHIGIRSETPYAIDASGNISSAPYHEYIQAELTATLEEGKSYEVSFYISSAENNIFQNNSIGALISEESDYNFGTFPIAPDIAPTDSIISSDEWVEFKGTYIAEGGEKFLTIGNLDLSVIDTFLAVNQFSSLYYYVDDVSVFENKRIDTTICQNDSIVFNANPHSSEHLWQDGTTDSIFVATQPGTYWYRGYYESIYHTDTFHLNYYNPLEASTVDDTLICHDDTIELTANHNYPGEVQYNWSTGDTTSSIFVSEEGQYTISVNNICQKIADQITVGKIPRIEFELGNDTTLCPHENVFLNPQLNEGQYEWQDNSSSYNYTANFPGSYWLTVSNECESVSDTINVEILDPLHLNFGPDIETCEFPIIIDVTNNNQAQYLWHDDSDKSYFSVEDTSTVWVTVFNECESLFDTITVTQFCGCHLFIPSAFTPNGDNVNDSFEVTKSHHCILYKYELTIYNRWGQQIFYTDDINNSWDGNYKNNTVQDGVFTYSIYYKFHRQKFSRIIGKIFLEK